MLLMFVGIGFVSVPTSTIASLADALARIETDLAEIKARLETVG